RATSSKPSRWRSWSRCWPDDGAHAVRPTGRGAQRAPRQNVIVAVAIYELHIEYAQSLKDKRGVVKSLRDKLRHRFEISAAEVGLQDVHQRARLAVTFVTLEH